MLYHNSFWRILPLLMLFGALFFALPVLAQEEGRYRIPWWSADGGGGTIGDPDDGYGLRGSIGQPDADTISGGGYTLQGGFWPAVSLAAVPTTTVTVTPALSPSPTATRSPGSSPTASSTATPDAVELTATAGGVTRTPTATPTTTATPEATASSPTTTATPEATASSPTTTATPEATASSPTTTATSTPTSTPRTGPGTEDTSLYLPLVQR